MVESNFVEPSATQVTYSKYLKTKELLALQQPLSNPEEHDELLFVIIHQVYELWFKQLLHELKACSHYLDEQKLMRVLAGFKRIDAIQKILVHQVDILETMAPDDFARFRDNLNPASGFQSAQFRVFEYTLGLKDRNYLRFFKNEPEATEAMNAALEAPSFFEIFLKFLKGRGYSISDESLSKAKDFPREPIPEITELFKTIYLTPYENSEIYLTLEAMIDIDEQLILWRYRHVAMVKRIIGSHGGTGGSSGAGYLTSTLEKKAFPEIWEVRNVISKTY